MDNNLRKSTFIYTLGNLVYVFSQWVMTVVTVRICGFQSAGLFSLALSVTAAPAIVTLFNIRSYQVSDTNNRFASRSYIASRHITCALSFLVCAVIALANGYSAEKVAISLVYMLLKLVEGYVDVYAAIEQKYNRLDIAGVSALLRGVATMALYTAVLAVTGNMLLGILCVEAACVVVLLVFDRRYAVGLIRLEDLRGHETRREIVDILRVCFPLAIVAFLNNLSISAPKLILEKSWGETLLGVYNSLSSPTILIQIVLNSLFAPWIPILSEAYLNGDRRFADSAARIIKGGALLSVGGMAAVVLLYKLGVVNLAMRLVYSPEIEQYTYWFAPLCLVSGITVINACLFGVCTLMRKVKVQYLIGVCGLAASYGVSRLCVPAQGMRGLVVATIVSLLVQILIQIAIIVAGYRQRFGAGRAK